MKDGWIIKKLGEVCEVVGGSTPKTNEERFWGGEHYWISPAELDGSKYISSTLRTITDEGVKSAHLQLLPVGTVLLSSRAPIGKVAITKVPMYCNQGFKNLVCTNQVINEYVYWFLVHSTDYLNSLGTGATFKEISKKVVEQVTIPVPPLPEQEKIVSELDCLSGVIEKKRQQLKELDALAQSIFYEMFGNPVDNERGWEVKSIKEIGKVITGNTPSRSVSEYYNSKDIEWIKTDNIESGKIHPTIAKEYLSKDGMMKGRVVECGAILVTCIAGSIASIGGCCIADRKVAFNQQINAVVPIGDINSLFLYYCLILSKRLIQDSASNGMKHLISKSNFEQIPLPLPPLPLQQTFAQKVEAIEKQKELIKQSIIEAETLFNARMQEYFG